jgi:hypothetical protein
MKKHILTVISFLFFSIGFSQNCTGVKTIISKDYSYINEKENFSLSFNSSWSIIFENQKAIMVALTDEIQQGSASVIKNLNGYAISSAHNISEDMVNKLFKASGIDVYNKIITNTYLKNIKSKQVEYDYKIYNLGDTYHMTGLIFMLLKDNYTYVFMFSCPIDKKTCYIPFYKNVMKNAFFGQEWY